MARAFNWPINPSSSGPIEVILDGTPTNISEDTTNPENSVTLPVTVFPLRPVGTAYLAAPSTNIPTASSVSFFTATENSFEVSISNTTSRTLVLQIDGAQDIHVPPGGLERQSLLIKTGEELTLQAVQSPATMGEVSANFFGKGA